MATLKENMAAYEAMQDDLELDFFGRWVIFYNRELAGTYETSGDAVDDAITRFGRGPYLIKQVGELPLNLPPYVPYRKRYANH